MVTFALFVYCAIYIILKTLTLEKLYNSQYTKYKNRTGNATFDMHPH